MNVCIMSIRINYIKVNLPMSCSVFLIYVIFQISIQRLGGKYADCKTELNDLHNNVFAEKYNISYSVVVSSTNIAIYSKHNIIIPVIFKLH